jgi:GGDEF domain-containing protein
MLEAIVDNYVSAFSSKYLVIPEVPNSVESLRNLNYDYIEWAEILDDFINTDRNYLATMKEEDSMFRSSQTGYSFQDLYNEYNLIHTVYLPSLYSLILENHITKDSKLLLSRYQYREDQNNLSIKNLEEALAVVESMLGTYSEKNQETINFLWGTGDSEETNTIKGPGSTNVLSSVYYQGDIADLNTYDSVLNRYIKLRSDLEQKVSDNEYCDYVVSAFLEDGEAASGEADPEDVLQIESIVAFIESRLRVLDEIMSISTSEYIKKEAMKNINVLSTVNVTATVNVKLYTALIVVVFFIFGVTVAVVVGRGLDFVEYHFYTDTVTDLPNRMSCDNEISKLEKKPLPIPFTCVVIALTNIKEINDVVGRDGGNEVLRVFASHIKGCAEDFGFLGYNGSLNFMGLFSVCDQSRALYFKNLLLRDIAEFNRGEHGVVIKYKIASSTATADKPHTIRELVSMAMSQMRIEKEVVADKVFTGPSGV